MHVGHAVNSPSCPSCPSQGRRPQAGVGIREELENRVRLEPSNPEFTLELTALRVERDRPDRGSQPAISQVKEHGAWVWKVICPRCDNLWQIRD